MADSLNGPYWAFCPDKGSTPYGGSDLTSTNSVQVDCVGEGQFITVDVLNAPPEDGLPGEMELCEFEVYGSYIPPSNNQVDNTVYPLLVEAVRKAAKSTTNQSAFIELPRKDFMKTGVGVSFLTLDSYVKVDLKYYRPLNETALEGGRGCWDWVECKGFQGTRDPVHHHNASHTCDSNATCSETVGSFACTCNPGWRGDGRAGNCSNIDECAENTHDCSPYAACIEVIGSFLCACNAGFYGNGTLCKDQDQCAAGEWGGPQNDCAIGPPAGPWGPGGTLVPAGNQSIAFCNDTFGSFTCTCLTGYEGNGTRCEEVNECVRISNVCTNTTYNVMKNVTAYGTWATILEEQNMAACKDVPLHNCDKNATCTNAPGSFTCSCNVGYIGNGTDCEDLNECDENTTCPMNAFCYNTVGSFYCECDRGYSGPDVYNCTACPAGQYKDVTGTSNCTHCPEDTYSEVPAVQTSSGCLQCPLNSDSEAGTTNSTLCLCRPGYTWQDLQTCSACVAGKYKTGIGPQACTACPGGTYLVSTAGYALSQCLACANHSDSPAGSETVSSCICNIGFTGSNGGPCTVCAPGTFKNSTGSETCTLCDENRYSEIEGGISDLECLKCTPFSRSVAGANLREQCLCIPGYAGAGLPGQLCIPCGPGTYKSVSGHEQCTPCPVNSFSPAGSTELLNCFCLPGFVGAGAADCAECVAGKYYRANGDGGGSGTNGTASVGTCQDCPPRSLSPAGSVEPSECACAPGAFGPNGQACQECEAGKYKPELGTDDCTECIRNSFSPAGSNRSEACTCNRGYKGSGDTQCSNVNECLETSNNNCAVGKAACTDTDGSFTCACIEPYFGNGTSCEPAYVRLAMQLQVEGDIQTFELYRDVFIQVLADLSGVSKEAVELLLVQAGLLQRRLLSVNGNGSAVNVTNVALVLNVIGLNLNDILTLLSPASLNSTMVLRGLPQVFVLAPARILAECGNGVIEASEACDDGNIINGDGCSLGCSVEVGWVCMTPSASTANDTCNVTHSTILFSSGSASCNASHHLHNSTNSSARTASMCKDINECVLNDIASSTCNASQESNHRNCTQALCDPFATCINTPGSFYCQCFPGFVQKFGLCVDDPGNNATLQENTVFENETTATLRNLPTNGFGHAVAIHRNYLLLGSLTSFDAYLYERQSPGGWPNRPTYILSRPDSGDGVYGLAVALYTAEDGVFRTRSVHAVIGTNRNKVYIHQTDLLGGWAGSRPHVLERDDLFFGTAVAASSTSVLVGAYGAHKAFLYTRRSDQSWPNEPSHTFSPGTEQASFGHVVAMTGDTIAIGALYVDRVFVFARASTGTWPSTAMQVLTTPAGDASLGASLSMTNKNLFVGAPGRQRVYIFTYNDTGALLTSPAVILSKSEGRFGHCVSNTDLYAVVGAFRANKAYIYKAHRNGTWSSDPVQTLSQGSVRARSIGFACGITNHDVALSSYEVNSPCCENRFDVLNAVYAFCCCMVLTQSMVRRIEVHLSTVPFALRIFTAGLSRGAKSAQNTQ